METLVQAMMLMKAASWAKRKKTMPTLKPEVEQTILLLETVSLPVFCGPVTFIGM